MRMGMFEILGQVSRHIGSCLCEVCSVLGEIIEISQELLLVDVVLPIWCGIFLKCGFNRKLLRIWDIQGLI